MFKDLSLRRVAQYGSMAVFQIVFGLEGLRATGLIMGYFFGQVCGYGLLAFRVWKHDHASFMAVRIESMKEQAKRFKNFPILSVPARVINELANKLPYILLNNSFGSAVVGLFDLPMRILEAPLSLLSRSVLDVFKERASRDYRTKGECRVIFLKTLKALILVSVVPFVLIFIFSPKIVPFFFGENWITAGTYTRILSIMFMLKFISAPMSYVLYIAEKQFVNLIWQIILLLFTVTAMYVGGVLNNPLISILLFSIMYTIMYGIHIYLGFRFSKSQASG